MPFTYTVQKARTQAAGAMLRRWAFRDPREPPPMDALVEVHELLDDLANGEDKLGAFVAGLSPGARADMAAGVLEVVHSFGEVWPSNCLPRQVQASSPLRANLLGGNLVLTYRFGFRFGQPRRQGGEVLSLVVLFDMRPGRAYEEEERYNRWYAALLDLFKSGIAPARVVTCYLGAASP